MHNRETDAPILHICPVSDWQAARESGEYRPPSLAQEGFIHCSRPEQILATANRFYSGVKDLCLLWIDPRRVKAEIRWEPAHGEAFPHIYGPLNADAVFYQHAFHPDPDGVFRSFLERSSTGLPVLHTRRLILRPFTLADADDVQRMAGEYEIASTALNIPHPYPDGAAQSWIKSLSFEFQSGIGTTLAVTLREDRKLVGAVGLQLEKKHHCAELGYWTGREYWGQGYATEAAQALVAYGFNELGLHRIYARHFRRNPASGRVMQKLGMIHEGTLREHVLHWGQYEDLEYYGLLESDWRNTRYPA